jgi:hypothetical protein
VLKRLAVVIPEVEEALEKVSFPVWSMVRSEDPVEEAMTRGLIVEVPITVSVAIGDDVPIPTLPLAKIAKSEAPVDDATWNGLRLDVLVACTLNTNVVFVALTPVNEPLSINVEVPKVVGVSQRVA